MSTPSWRQVSPEEWDAFDHACILGIEKLQLGQLQAGGDIARNDPKRSDIRFPYLTDRSPKLHQIVWVTKYVSTLFAGGGCLQTAAPSGSQVKQEPSESSNAESYVGRRRPFLLCDDAGLGKTTEALMVIAYFRWLLETQDGPRQVPLLSKAVLEGMLRLDTTHMGRFQLQALVSRKPVLVVTLHATKEQFREEIDEVLERDSFEPFSYTDLRHPARRKSLERRFVQYRDRKTDVCPIVVMSWHDLLTEDSRIDREDERGEMDGFIVDDEVDDEEFEQNRSSEDGSEDDGDSEDGDSEDSDSVSIIEVDDSDSSNDIDDIEILSQVGDGVEDEGHDEEGDAIRAKIYETDWSFLVLDEVQEAREPASFRFQHVRRLPRMADHTIGMTATPFWNRPVNLLNILRACGLDTSQPLKSWQHLPKPAKRPSFHARKRMAEDYGDCHPSYRDFVHFCQTLDRERQNIQRAVKALPSKHATAATAPLDAWGVLFPEGPSTAAAPLKRRWDVYVEWLKWVTWIPLELASGQVVRRLREDHLKLSPAVDTVKSIKLSRNLRAAYDRLCKEQTKKRSSAGGTEGDEGEDGDWVRGRSRGSTFGASLPAGFDVQKRIILVDPARINKKYKKYPSPKVEIAIKLCKEVLDKDEHLPVRRKRKIAIFCEWSDPLIIEHITKRFKRADIPVAVLNGRMSDDERAKVIESFQKDSDHKATCGTRSRIVLFSQAVSAGVNLHRASVMITLDNVWTFAKREQIEGRVLRLGQTNPVCVYRIVAPNTIDEGMMWHQMRKRRLMEEMDKMWCSKVTPLRHEKCVMPLKPASLPPNGSRAQKKRKTNKLKMARPLKPASLPPNGSRAQKKRKANKLKMARPHKAERVR